MRSTGSIRRYLGNWGPRRHKVRQVPRLEVLEDRSPLTGQAFAVIDGVLSATGAGKITIQVSKQNFTLTKSGQVVLELVASTSGSVPLMIGAPVAATPRTIGHEAAAGGNWRIAALAPGKFTFLISGGTAGASYTVDFSLVGDVDHNGNVNSADINAIRSRFGVTSKSRRFLPGADLFNQNRISAADLRFALSDLGAATSLKPLSLSAGAVRLHGSDPLADVVVHSQPNVSIVVTERGIAVGTAKIGKTGQVRFAAGLLTGQNVFNVVATDSFGQRATAQDERHAGYRLQLPGSRVSALCRPVDRQRP